MGLLPRCPRSASLPGLGREQPAGPLMTGEQGVVLAIEKSAAQAVLALRQLCS